MNEHSDHASLVQIFLSEALDSLERLWTALHPPEQALPTPEAVRAEYIAAHTLRGAASLYGFADVAAIAERLEAELERIDQLSGSNWPAHAELLCTLVESLRREVDVIAKSDRSCVTTHADSPPAAVSSSDLPDSYLLPDMDEEVYSYFAPEAQEYLDSIEAALLRLEKEPHNSETIQELFRTAHTLKGSAYTVGFRAVGDLTHHVEDFLDAIREGHRQMSAELADVTLKVVDVIRALMRREVTNLVPVRGQFASVRDQLRALADSIMPLRKVSKSQPAQETPVETSSEGAIESEMPAEPVPSEILAELEAVEPVAQRSESGEPHAAVGSAKPTDEAAVIRVSRERLERLLNLVGELVIGRGRLEQRLLALEQLSHQVLSVKSRMLGSVRNFEEKHAFTFMPVQGAEEPRNVESLLTDFGGLELDKYDDVNILARQIAEISTDVGESMSQLNASIRKAREDMAQLQRLTLGMRDEIAHARMVPIGTPFTRFKRAVREMAKSSGKEVNLVVSGETTEVDTVLVERLVDPLIHLVRNAVFHGIEPTTVRQAAGKPPTGTVYLHAAHRGSAVVIEVEDDGAGLDVAKIKSKAVALGLVRAELATTLTDLESAKLIFLPGFSTADGIGDQAGRGMGLDVVKRAVEGMNGQIEVETARNVGTKFTLTLPLTLLISMALLVRVGRERYAVPLPSIREVILPKTGAIQDVGGRPMVHVGEEAVEVQPLSRLLGVEAASPPGSQPVVVVRTATGVFGLAVDELLGRQEIVIKTLGALKPLQESCFGGATIDPEGRVILVLDVGRLLSAGSREVTARLPSVALLPEARKEAAVEPVTSHAREHQLRILLIDDSLSVRKFVGRMLERAGYVVDTAVDGEEGLRRASSQDYHLIITDLEMPKLNGYEVIQALRERPQGKDLPIIVMTTRAGEKHRRMALSVGATAYIAKPVEERSLIQEVEHWIGQYSAVKHT